jgi:hypothetical protein
MMTGVITLTSHSININATQWIHTLNQWITHHTETERETFDLLCNHTNELLSGLNDLQQGQLIPIEIAIDE